MGVMRADVPPCPFIRTYTRRLLLCCGRACILLLSALPRGLFRLSSEHRQTACSRLSVPAGRVCLASLPSACRISSMPRGLSRRGASRSCRALSGSRCRLLFLRCVLLRLFVCLCGCRAVLCRAASCRSCRIFRCSRGKAIGPAWGGSPPLNLLQTSRGS